MILLLDTSAAVEIVLKLRKANQFGRAVLQARSVISSELFHAEISNVFWKYVKAGLLDRTAAGDLLRLATELVDEFHPISSNNVEALSEAVRLNHPVYDMLYLTLARRHGAVLASMDKQLNRLARKEGIVVAE